VLSALRRGLYPVRLALVRLRSRVGRSLLVAAGVAVGAGLLALAYAGSVAVQDRFLQRALEQLGPSSTSVQAVWSGVPAQSSLTLAELDRDARHALRGVTGREPFGVMLYRQAPFGGTFVNIGAVDGLGRWLNVTSGRLPRRCRPDDCELVVVGSKPAAPRLPFLHVVGRATLAPDAPLGAYFGGGPGRPPLLLAEGVSGLARTPLPDSGLVARTYGWVLPVSPGSIHDWQVGGFADRIGLATSKLAAQTDLFSVSAPIDALADSHRQAAVAGRRLLLVGGSAAILVAAFTVLAAGRLRRDAQAAWRRLSWFGARPSQLVTLSSVESAGIAGVAAAIGWLAGAAAALLLAHELGAPAGAVVLHSALAGRGILIALLVALAAALVVLVSLRATLFEIRGVGVTVADVAAIAAVGAVALAISRGDADAAELGSGAGTDAFLLLLPPLVVLAGAVLFARLTGPLLRSLERAARRGSVPFRLAALSLARGGGTALLAVVFLVASISIAVFASAYRSTLSAGQTEQARYAVPADFVLSEDLQRLVTVQQAAPPSAYASLGRAEPVLRESGNVAGRPGAAFTLVGLSPASLRGIDGWRADFSDRPPAELAARLRPPGSAGLHGIDLPARTRRLAVPVTVDGNRVNLSLSVRGPRGDFSQIPLGEPGRGAHVLTAAIPLAARGGRVVAIRVQLPLTAQFLAGHRESGTTLSVSNASRGVLRLGRLRAGGTVLDGYRGWLGTGGLGARPGDDGLVVRYLVNRAAASFLRPRQPTDGVPLPVLATPAIAAAAGPGRIVPLDVNDQPLTARVAGVVRAFPSVTGDAVVADRELVSTALNARTPGSAVAGELWLDANPGAAARLAAPPFDRLAVTSQAALEQRLRSDPLSRGTLAVLGVTAVIALALALVGILLVVVADGRDESGELFDLEVQGASPFDLRTHLRLRAALVTAAGLVGGVLTGAALVALVVSFVTVTATAGRPVPSLALVLDWPVLLAGLAGFLLAAALLVWLGTARVFERAARLRASEGLA
jgi:hypothetical protein